jgi:ComF family protein
MINIFLNILFPEKCPECEKPALNHETSPLCSECWSSIRPYGGPGCQKCGKPLPSDEALHCGDCLTEEPAFHYARSYGIYEDVLKKGINLFKYHGKKRLSRPLARFLMQMDLPFVDAVIPVPVYRKRLRQREFNQSALLSREIAKKRNVELITNCLVKTRDTQPQVGLSSEQRKTNLRNVFAVKNNKAVTAKNIILVDDVVTTGTTIRECSKALKKAGAANIYAISLAHGYSD